MTPNLLSILKITKAKIKARAVWVEGNDASRGEILINEEKFKTTKGLSLKYIF